MARGTVAEVKSFGGVMWAVVDVGHDDSLPTGTSL